MCAAKPAPVTDTELASLFSGLERFPVLILAVSGGPDSTALLVLAARWRAARPTGPTLIAVTVDHGLRPEAAAEATAVAALAHSLGLVHRTLTWAGPKPKSGLQQAARAARYGLLAEAAREAGAGAVLTAHTRDDQAETVLIRLMRGSGLAGLGAMEREAVIPGRAEGAGPESRVIGQGPSLDSGFRVRSRRERPGMTVLVRPFLDLPKARLIATLEAAKIPYAHDPSNRDPRFTRSRLRALMPELAEEGLDAARLALLARRAQRAQTAIEAAVDRAAAELTVKTSIPGAVVLDAEGFARLPGEVGLRLVGRAINELGDEGPVELAKLEALCAGLESAQASHAQFRRSLAGAVVTLKSLRILVERAPPRSGKRQSRAAVEP